MGTDALGNDGLGTGALGTGADVLAAAAWECAGTPAGELAGPEGLGGATLRWTPAAVPGTVAGALRAAGVPERSTAELDGQDWWFRCRFAGPEAAAGAGPDGSGTASAYLLELSGLATVADVWLNGRHLVRSETMFAPHRIRIGELAADNELVVRCSALQPLLGPRRPRPRWKTAGASHQSLRWFRTTLLGRQPGWVATPAPVGPWRPVHLVSAPGTRIVRKRVVATCPPADEPGEGRGTVTVELVCATDGNSVPGAVLEVAGTRSALVVEGRGDQVTIRGSADLVEVERWWPHTHGPQPLYPVAVEVGPDRLELGSVGFRTVEVDDDGGGFTLSVNGVPLFCRGGCWYPIDPVSFTATDDDLGATLSLVRECGMNMVRIPGGTVYEEDRFFSLCDRLGVMVWQDAMFAFLDPPDDPGFLATVTDELTGVLTGAACHPSLAVVCGGQELEEQPAMFGLSRDTWPSTLTHVVVADLAADCAPGVPYLTSSPSGGDPPFRVDRGVSHYTGVGVFMRPLDDLRRAEPRFVSEGLAFSIPPERATVDDRCGGARQAGHDPSWKRAVHHDTGGSWDLEDVRDHYVGVLFGEDPATLRRHDPERALDLGRAAVTQVMAEAAAEWRRPGSGCAGMLLVGLRDLRVGAGWGVIDALGRPKAPWYALARACRPVAVLATDEGLNGLALHLVNDGGRPVPGRLTVQLFTGDHLAEEATAHVELPARGGIDVPADSLFDGFRDLTYAYRFGPRSYELVVARLSDGLGRTLAETGYLPGGAARPLQAEIGLQAGVERADGETWSLTVSTRRFAHFVCVDVPGFRPANSWFHLPPGGSTVIPLRPEGSPEDVPRGQVRALNSVTPASVSP
ncbi:MAG: glycosyl hydrolase 2 galactose-binding domain-containing protein [Acidimicrobiales bacterium]